MDGLMKGADSLQLTTMCKSKQRLWKKDKVTKYTDKKTVIV